MIATYGYSVYHHSTDALIGSRQGKMEVASLEEAERLFSSEDGESWLVALDGKPIHTFYPRESVAPVAVNDDEDNIPF